MKKLENFNSDKFLCSNKSAFMITGGAPSVTGKFYMTDKVNMCGETECGEDTEFIQDDVVVK
jgi:hypothetical protein